MKLIIAGSRDVYDVALVAKVVEESGIDVSKVTEVVSGHANGIDKAGEEWAKVRGIPVKTFPAKWRQYGNAAGPIRNAEMAEYADYLIAITTGGPGTTDMIFQMTKRKKPQYTYTHKVT